MKTLNRDIRISVIIPSYNRGDVIVRAVESALDQSFSPHEVIVVDDGSDDETPQVLASYGDRIRMIRQENRGVSSARNRGLQSATGNYIAFLDSDDTWHPEKLLRQVQFLNDHDCRMVITDSAPAGNPEGKTSLSRTILGERLHGAEVIRQPFELFVEQNVVHLSTVLVHRECIDRAGGFDESMKVAEDTDLWIRIALHEPLGVLPEILASRDVRADRLSGKRKEELEGRIRIFDKLLASGELSAKQMKLVKDRRNWIIGRLLFLLARHKQTAAVLRMPNRYRPTWLFSTWFWKGIKWDYQAMRQRREKP